MVELSKLNFTLSFCLPFSIMTGAGATTGGGSTFYSTMGGGGGSTFYSTTGGGGGSTFYSTTGGGGSSTLGSTIFFSPPKAKLIPKVTSKLL